MKTLSDASAIISQGEILQVGIEKKLDASKEDYLKVIEGKTASLIRTSATLGAIASNADSEIVNAISSWGWYCGIIFQISDDILDLTSDSETLGKPA